MLLMVMKFNLKDHSGEGMGEIIVIASREGSILGEFSPASCFATYAPLFKEFEQAANDQLLVEIDRLEGEIYKLGFYVVGPCPQGPRYEIENLQIMERGISFRLKGGGKI
ncbi:hypothetical protein [Burkholderia sp. AU18528]|uniref:hypothetical protein n=1 Tax=Burkholderia sp. AU18528 TaxID=2015350 RepID=UPI00117C7F59|nr:hypothetical protein [Burkholderia sp. AU18528]